MLARLHWGYRGSRHWILLLSCCNSPLCSRKGVFRVLPALKLLYGCKDMVTSRHSVLRHVGHRTPATLFVAGMFVAFVRKRRVKRGRLTRGAEVHRVLCEVRHTQTDDTVEGRETLRACCAALELCDGLQNRESFIYQY